ncbi:MAG: START-like domain-containing protein [Porphyromonas sp.]|nr:START-like domain-containing protein [Porphyromonas sp.]
MAEKKKQKKVAPINPGLVHEYLFDRASVRSIWNEISTSRGLTEWFAEKVDIYGDDIHIYWDLKGDDRSGKIVEFEAPFKIKWVWDDDLDSFVSMEIVETELSRTVSLLVEDHDLNMERETLDYIWENHIEKLMASLGLQ